MGYNFQNECIGGTKIVNTSVCFFLLFFFWSRGCCIFIFGNFQKFIFFFTKIFQIYELTFAKKTFLKLSTSLKIFLEKTEVYMTDV